MAIGRVKDSTLKVFGNDYPTRCVSYDLLVNFVVINLTSETEHVFGTISTSWT